MLAHPNRVTRGDDYRRISRRGTRVSARGLVVLAELRADATAPTRFGFIITKRVGVAVVRNRLRRRLKAISRELLVLIPTGASFIIRVFPEAADLSYDELRTRTRAATLSASERIGVTAIPEQCSCADVVD
ncbi:ribonuclease P protein component [Gulosibacter molinativorax]|uniref:Ribonuclease P protein component n=1 Tax=Gulosibacter molinativorax TaxID=256821 RepID=A0ABT7CAC0_9MICO|nr:ribonuclease P protein component [Gulosibacter molinativorax]